MGVTRSSVRYRVRGRYRANDVLQVLEAEANEPAYKAPSVPHGVDS